MSRLSTPAYPNDAPIHGLTDTRLAYSQPTDIDWVGVEPPPLALAQALQHPLLSRLKPRQWQPRHV
jgi:hypothetical protein